MIRNKKILIVLWHLGVGGMQKRMADISEDSFIDKKNIQIYILVKHDIKFNSLYKRLLNNKNVKLIFFSKNKNFLNNIIFCFWLSLKIILIKPDLILTFLDHISVFVIFLKRFKIFGRFKVVINESMLTSKYVVMQRNKFANLWNYLIKKNYIHADRIIVPSKACKNDLIVNYLINKNKIILIKNWTLFKAKNSDKKKNDVIFIGRIEKEKGILNLINILKIIKKKKLDISFLIVGDGSEKDYFINTIYKLNLDKMISFVGYSNNIQRLLLNSKLLLLPTINEGMPNVVIEAGACGVPSVVSNFIGAEELIVNNIDGYIYTNNSDAVEKINFLLSNDNKRKEMGFNIQNKIMTEFNVNNQKRFIETLVSEMFV